ncbi:MAG: ATP-binding protein [Clostridiaceae bacterium]|nr:ATP-binding protein [Clostridiaceae bacterium]
MYLDIEEKLIDKINDRISIPDSMMAIQLNRLTLQPIVENAIQHAMREDDDSLTIEVVGYAEDNTAVIEIRDNGVGIPRQKASAFNNDQTISAEGHGIGLMNVNRRIKLRFGEQYGLYLVEKDTPGAIVQIRIPMLPPRSENLLGLPADII